MSHIHHTTMQPSKLELLAEWLPKQPWYEGDAAELRKAGGFRLDDPAGEVGIEFMAVGSGAEDVFLVPMTYRAQALPGAEAGLIGTSEHGVLGERFIYDGLYDPVLVTQLFALMRGEAAAQMQSVSDTPDPSVRAELDSDDPVEPQTPRTDEYGTDVPVGELTLQVNRRLEAGTVPRGVLGWVAGGWRLADGTDVAGVYFTAR